MLFEAILAKGLSDKTIEELNNFNKVFFEFNSDILRYKNDLTADDLKIVNNAGKQLTQEIQIWQELAKYNKAIDLASKKPIRKIADRIEALFNNYFNTIVSPYKLTLVHSNDQKAQEIFDNIIGQLQSKLRDLKAKLQNAAGSSASASYEPDDKQEVPYMQEDLNISDFFSQYSQDIEKLLQELEQTEKNEELLAQEIDAIVQADDDAYNDFIGKLNDILKKFKDNANKGNLQLWQQSTMNEYKTVEKEI